jgi:hypothetical protein
VTFLILLKTARKKIKNLSRVPWRVIFVISWVTFYKTFQKIYFALSLCEFEKKNASKYFEKKNFNIAASVRYAEAPEEV